MGICAAPELYQRAMSELFSNTHDIEIVMDDILIHATTAEEHDKILVEKELNQSRICLIL